jgi:hypothetical protein
MTMGSSSVPSFVPPHPAKAKTMLAATTRETSQMLFFIFLSFPLLFGRNELRTAQQTAGLRMCSGEVTSFALALRQSAYGATANILYTKIGLLASFCPSRDTTGCRIGWFSLVVAG